MNLRKLNIDSEIIRSVVATVLLFVLSMPVAYSQTEASDSVESIVSAVESKYDIRLKKHKSWSQKMIPDIVLFQYAAASGNIIWAWDGIMASPSNGKRIL